MATRRRRLLCRAAFGVLGLSLIACETSPEAAAEVVEAQQELKTSLNELAETESVQAVVGRAVSVQTAADSLVLVTDRLGLDGSSAASLWFQAARGYHAAFEALDAADAPGLGEMLTAKAVFAQSDALSAYTRALAYACETPGSAEKIVEDAVLGIEQSGGLWVSSVDDPCTAISR